MPSDKPIGGNIAAAQPTVDKVVEEIHRIRREISDRFGGDLHAITEDAAKRLATSGEPIWRPENRTADAAARPS